VRCGTVAADPFDTQAVARELRVHESRVVLDPQVPGAIVTHRGSPLLRQPGFAVVATRGTWVVASSCR